MIKINQHTIPKFLLKNWGEDLMMFFDMKLNMMFQFDSKNATVIKNYYEDEERKVNEVEDLLSKIENSAAPIIKKLALADGDIAISPKESMNLFIFFETLSSRSMRNLSVGVEEPRDQHEWLGKILLAPKNKTEQLNQIVELTNVDWNKIIEHYWKTHIRKITKICTEKKVESLLIDEEYESWEMNKEYSINVLRTLIDMAQRKIAILHTNENTFILGDAVSAGSRNSSFNMNYYAYPISKNRSLIFYFAMSTFVEYQKTRNVQLFEQFKKIKIFKINEENNIKIIDDEKYNGSFVSTWINFYRMQESTNFLIISNDSKAINTIKNVNNVYKTAGLFIPKFQNYEKLLEEVYVHSV